VVSPSDPSHYFDAEPAIGSSTSTADLVLPDVSLQLETDRGVFSRERVDTGTKLLLLEGPPADAADRLLVDLGAGYGPIACTLAARNPQATVWAVDVNRRARELCARNARAAGLANVVVASPADVPAELAADRIWSNPPIRIGKQPLHELLASWLDRLAPGGSAHLVVQRHLGADSLHRWLESQGWTVSRRAARRAYRLLDVGPRAGQHR
jgi:16S rRNA (guanine1207-N2)-methyltransferase